MEIFYVLTVAKTHPSGVVEQFTVCGVPDLPPGTTRAGVFHAARTRLPERLREDATVVFFSAELNALVPARTGVNG